MPKGEKKKTQPYTWEVYGLMEPGKEYQANQLGAGTRRWHALRTLLSHGLIAQRRLPNKHPTYALIERPLDAPAPPPDFDLVPWLGTVWRGPLPGVKGRVNRCMHLEEAECES